MKSDAVFYVDPATHMQARRRTAGLTGIRVSFDHGDLALVFESEADLRRRVAELQALIDADFPDPLATNVVAFPAPDNQPEPPRAA